ncbi:MAG: hypothetical protein Kow0037_01230 [Calditrichia bacterium]
MTKDDFITTIQPKDYPRPMLAQRILHDTGLRELAIDLMCHHPAIMVYYHCYEIVKDASAQDARPFLAYQAAFQHLLTHQNSYHRDFGLVLLANLTAFSETVNFTDVATAYFQCLDDPKMMTAQCCLQSLNHIITHRQEYTALITTEVLHRPHFQRYTEKQQALLHSDVLNILQTAYRQGVFQEAIRAAILEHCHSRSPKTRQLAKRLSMTMLSDG